VLSLVKIAIQVTEEGPNHISAAFDDTIAHGVLLQRLQTDFGVGGAAIAPSYRQHYGS